MDCNGHTIAGNDTGYGILLSGKTNITSKNCAVSHFSYGIFLSYSSLNTVINNNFSNNSWRGIGLDNANSNTIKENAAGSNQYEGIQIWNSTDNAVTDNNISNNYIGIRDWCCRNNFSNNTMDFNQIAGIYLGGWPGGWTHSYLIENNTISHSNYGIYLANVLSSSIFDNLINFNQYGIYLQGLSETYSGGFYMDWKAADNTIKDSRISDNDQGIYLGDLTEGNKAYHNNLLDNLTQAHNEGINNLFNNGYPSGGNYWSDYTGTDEKSGPNQDQPGSDKIGDTPYIFSGGQDRYPFMAESGWEAPPVPTYNVAVILAEPADVPHGSNSITAQPCKLIPEKTYPNGHSKEYYQDLAYCVADYHKENSFGTLNLNFEIFDNNRQWFRTNRNEEDYIGKEHEFVIDAINLTTGAGVDLSGKDMVIVVHAGTSAQRVKNKLTTATWTPQIQPLGYPPYKIIAAEDDPVGAWAHETGHILGELVIPLPDSTIIPDLSDMGLSSVFTFRGERYDILFRGAWDIMAGGSWNNDGNDPSHMSFYTKEFLQWLKYDIYPKSAYGEYWINSLDTSKFGDSVLRYNLAEDVNDESPQYYILESRNRNLKTWDSSLPEEKVLVLYRVDTHNFPEYGYDESNKMWNTYRSIVIPGGIREYFVNDGVLTPNGETYRDFDSLVKFTALTDRTADDKYEIQTKIEEITYDSFEDMFSGVILKPSSFFRQKIKEIFPPNPVKAPELYGAKGDTPKTQLSVAWFNPKTGKWEGGGPTPARILTKKEIIQYALVILSPVFLLIILLVLLNKKVVPRLEPGRKKKIIKIFIKTFLIIFMIFVAILFLLAAAIISETPNYSNINNSREIAAPSLLPLTSPDLDLHLYTDDGRHIGVNYETGEYEIQIEGAIVSGDNQDAPEWIF
ncbi:right-handed parallel beta-helix repeat-containing protein, partial [Candidatus Falkowbacteria bacterium]|nr:right-handed parallel beta-helix repeat-containing protein [Candidatus Falkowbacteria bacterium]